MEKSRIPETRLKKKVDDEGEVPDQEQDKEQTSISVTVIPEPVGAGSGVNQ